MRGEAGMERCDLCGYDNPTGAGDCARCGRPLARPAGGTMLGVGQPRTAPEGEPADGAARALAELLPSPAPSRPLNDPFAEDTDPGLRPPGLMAPADPAAAPGGGVEPAAGDGPGYDLDALTLATAPPPRSAAALVQTLGERGAAAARRAAAEVAEATQRGRTHARRLLEAALHVVRIVQENRAHRRAIGERHAELARDQARLTDALTRLGQAVRELGSADPALAADTAGILLAEDRRTAAEQERSTLAARRAERAREHAATEEQQSAALAGREEALAHLAGELSARSAERDAQRQELSRLEAQVKTLGAEVGEREAQALKAQDPAAQATLRTEADRGRTRVAAIEPERDELVGRGAELEAAIVDLTASVAEARAAVAEARRGRDEAVREARRELAELEAEAERRLAEIGLAERAIAKHTAALGNLAYRQRLGEEPLSDSYAAIDGVAGAISRQLIAIGTLEEEIARSRDAPFRTGVMVLGSAALITLILLVLLFRACGV
jgi:chromosome segregation ATPase